MKGHGKICVTPGLSMQTNNMAGGMTEKRKRCRQMKLLLAACNAKYIHSNLAVYNLKAAAEGTGAEILLKEYTINQGKDLVLGDIYLEKPDVVCFSCYIWNISFITEVAENLHRVLRRQNFGPEVRKYPMMRCLFCGRIPGSPES